MLKIQILQIHRVRYLANPVEVNKHLQAIAAKQTACSLQTELQMSNSLSQSSRNLIHYSTRVIAQYSRYHLLDLLNCAECLPILPRYILRLDISPQRGLRLLLLLKTRKICYKDRVLAEQ